MDTKGFDDLISKFQDANKKSSLLEEDIISAATTFANTLKADKATVTDREFIRIANLTVLLNTECGDSADAKKMISKMEEKLLKSPLPSIQTLDEVLKMEGLSKPLINKMLKSVAEGWSKKIKAKLLDGTLDEQDAKEINELLGVINKRVEPAEEQLALRRTVLIALEGIEKVPRYDEGKDGHFKGMRGNAKESNTQFIELQKAFIEDRIKRARVEIGKYTQRRNGYRAGQGWKDLSALADFHYPPKAFQNLSAMYKIQIEHAIEDATKLGETEEKQLDIKNKLNVIVAKERKAGFSVADKGNNDSPDEASHRRLMKDIDDVVKSLAKSKINNKSSIVNPSSIMNDIRYTQELLTKFKEKEIKDVQKDIDGTLKNANLPDEWQGNYVNSALQKQEKPLAPHKCDAVKEKPRIKYHATNAEDEEVGKDMAHYKSSSIMNNIRYTQELLTKFKERKSQGMQYGDDGELEPAEPLKKKPPHTLVNKNHIRGQVIINH